MMFVKRYGKFKLLLVTGDIISLIVGGILSFIINFYLKTSVAISFEIITKIAIFVVAGVFTIISFRFNNLYKYKTFFNPQKQFILITQNLFWTFIVILALNFILKPQNSIYGERLSILTFILFTYLFVLFFRFNFRNFFSTLLDNNFLKRKIIAIGAGELGNIFYNEIKNGNFNMFEFIGFIDDKSPRNTNDELKNLIIGSTEELINLSKINKIDEIFITINNISQDNLLQLIKKARACDCNINVLSNHFGIIEKKIDQCEFKNLEYVTIHAQAISSYFKILKRIVDIIFSSLLILCFSPLLLFCALLIKIDSAGPVFYAPNAIGKDGRPFKFFKFRSMKHNVTHDPHKKLVEDFMNGNIIGAKLRSDCRVTKVGKVLRKYSLDELPQLFNVLLGDMSLVGPRPSTIYEFEKMEEWHKKRFEILPGMTGLWQVAGRSEVSFIDMIMMDIYYVENGSFWLDLYILVKTVFVVIKAKGGH